MNGVEQPNDTDIIQNAIHKTKMKKKPTTIEFVIGGLPFQVGDIVETKLFSTWKKCRIEKIGFQMQFDNYDYGILFEDNEKLFGRDCRALRAISDTDMTQQKFMPKHQTTLQQKETKMFKDIVFKTGIFGIGFVGNRITEVHHNSEALHKGVQVGWIIHKINGAFQKNDNDKIDLSLKLSKKSGTPTIIQFKCNEKKTQKEDSEPISIVNLRKKVINSHSRNQDAQMEPHPKARKLLPIVIKANKPKNVSKALSGFDSQFLNNLTSQIQKFWNREKTSDAVRQKRRKLVSKVQQIIKNKWKFVELILFGSVATGFDMRTSDIDICLNNTPRSTEPSKVIKILTPIFKKKFGHQNIKAILTARFPIIKLSLPEGVSCDVIVAAEDDFPDNINYKNRLLSTYCAMDQKHMKLKLLVAIVKRWSQKQGIGDAWTGGLNSYGWSLLVIQFLQMRDKPVLPCLHKHNKQGKGKFKMTQLRMFRDLHRKNKFQKMSEQNEETLGELLVSFFYTYGFLFNSKNQCVSIRCGRFVGGMFKCMDTFKSQRRNFLIEDPFEPWNNVGRSITPAGTKDIISKCKQTYNKLKSMRGNKKILETILQNKNKKKSKR